LLQRRIGLCGDATRAPTGACKQQKGRTVFTTEAAPATSFCWSRKKAKNPPYPYHGLSETKSINQSDQTAIDYRDRSQCRLVHRRSSLMICRLRAMPLNPKFNDTWLR